MELLEAVRGGNASAYGMLYQRHAVAARSLARQFLQGDEAVEDILVETFAGVLDVVRAGEGPFFAFRPYLLMAVRRYVAIGAVDLTDPDGIYVDPELTGLERAVLARAFFSLPERWRMVLWHMDVENARPAEISHLLGMSVGGVGALADRARDGLRQAYLQLHREGGPRDECGPILAKIPQHVEGRLPKREGQTVDEHVAECIDCRAAFLELADLAQGLRVIVGQLVVGPHIDGYLADLAREREAAGSPPRGVAAAIRRMPAPHRALVAGAAATAATVAFILIAEPLSDGGPGGWPAARGPRSPGTAGTPSGPTPSPSARSATPEKPDRTQDVAPPQPGGPSHAAAPTGRHQSGRHTTGGHAATPEHASLAATIDPLGALVRARSGIVGVRLRNTGEALTRDVKAAVTLPSGVALMAGGAAKGRGTAPSVGTLDGWACRTARQVVTCSHGALAPGEATTVFLRVLVAADAPVGGGLGLRVTSGGQVVSTHSTLGVRSSGATARYAADGRVTTRAIGNTLLSSSPAPAGCETKRIRPGTGPRIAVPVDHDGDASTRSSSCGLLELPAGGRVLWAGLYWSATGRSSAPVGLVRVKAPGSSRYVTVRATEVAGSDLPIRHGYQAFADVTSLVRGAGSGRWWVADPSMRWGASQHAGWSLVVMATDDSRPYSRAAVLDTAAVVGGKGGLRVPLAGLAPAATPARIDLVVWNGDDGTDGLVALSDHAAKAGAGGPAKRGLGGVIVGTMHTVLGRHAVLNLATRDESLLFGVVAVSARSWS
ncbi:hypothetical protein Pth03_21670 [Planotetraspora thailandica]|uniref:Uncharacterized protein n=1 Tax=Planotetraspora thailandica TaxID=487172 RepID=A0A8J3XY27_9ACTN|nr:hypothetical protein Pth03_21670 [Planotetraspora thailandica]